MSFRLTIVTYGCTVVTYGPRQRCPKGRTVEPCSPSATAVRSAARRCRAIGARLFDFSATSVSVPAASTRAERTGSGERTQGGVHSQAFSHFDRARAVVRICQKDFHQRSRESGVMGAPATRGRSWLSRGESRHARFGWNIDLTACWRQAGSGHISCWCQTGDGRFEGYPLNQPILIRR